MNGTTPEIRSGAVTLKGTPVDLAGPELKVGDKAPDFSLQDNGLGEVTLASGKGKTRIIATVPSLDTGTCATETRKFNEKAAAGGAEVLVVSMDLPFAQKRWCAAEGIDKVKTLSAHRCSGFGEKYGVLIKGGGLDRCLARAVFVVDGGGRIKHVEYVPEVSQEPNYEAALAAAG